MNNWRIIILPPATDSHSDFFISYDERLSVSRFWKVLVLKMSRLSFGTSENRRYPGSLVQKNFFDLRATVGLAIQNRMYLLSTVDPSNPIQCKKFGLVSDPSTKTIEALFIGRDPLIISMISHSITYAKSWPKPRIRTGTQHGWFSNGQVQSPLAWLHNYLIFRKMPWYCIVLWSHLWTY